MTADVAPVTRSIIVVCDSPSGVFVHKAPNLKHFRPVNLTAEIAFHQRFQHSSIPELVATSYELEGRQGLLRRHVEGQEMFYIEKMYTDDGLLVAVILKLLEVLEFIHQGGYVYADVNPLNIILSEVDGEIHLGLIDFELARPIGGAPIEIGHKCFSYEHISSPEKRYDLYSVASMLTFFRAKPRISSPMVPSQVIRFCVDPWRTFLEQFVLNYDSPALENVGAFRAKLVEFQQQLI